MCDRIYVFQNAYPLLPLPVKMLFSDTVTIIEFAILCLQIQ